MTQFYNYNGADMGNQVVRLGKMGPLDVQAQQEQVGSGGLDFDDPAGSLNIVGLKPFHITETAGPAAFTLTGTWTKTAGSATYVGVGTLATTELVVGRMMIVPGGGGTSNRRVSVINSDTNVTVDYADVFSASGQTATVGSLQRLWTGYTGLRSIQRGQGDSLRTGAARRWSVTLDDLNSFLSFRVFTESDANRPAETDLMRIRWLLKNSRMAGTIFDLGDIPGLAVPQTGGVAMDPADYRGQRTADVLNDCSQVSGKNAYCYFEESENKIGLVYDFHSGTRLSSPIRLSNVPGQIDSDEHTVGATMTFPIEPDWVEHDDPSRVVAGVYVPYGSKSQAAYVKLLSTATTFGYRDAVAPTSSVKTLTKATALGKRYLADNATEDVLLTGSVKLPREVVTQLTAGLRTQVYVSHLPSVNAPGYTWCRVLRQSIAQDEESDQFYTVNMDLTPIAFVPPPPAGYTGTYTFGGDGLAPAGPPSSGPVYLKNGNTYTWAVSAAKVDGAGGYAYNWLLDTARTGGTNGGVVSGVGDNTGWPIAGYSSSGAHGVAFHTLVGTGFPGDGIGGSASGTFTVGDSVVFNQAVPVYFFGSQAATGHVHPNDYAWSWSITGTFGP